MTVYEKNLKTLAEHYPEMDVMIKEAEQEIEAQIEIFEEGSYEGEKILRVKRDEKLCYLGGKRNPIEPAQVWVESLGKLPRNAPVLMMGVGNPFYLKELTEKMEKEITIIIYEPSLQIFLKFLEMIDIAPFFERHLVVFWVEGLRDMELKNMRGMLEEVLKFQVLQFFRHLILPNYEVLFQEEAVEFTRLCRDVALREVSIYNTQNRFSSTMVKNLFLNAKYLCDGYKTTQLPEVIPRDIPGILVAAGPSLNKNIQELKKAKGKAFIIAVDTAIKPLLKAGIVPDMFAIVDGGKPLDLVKIDEAREIPMVATQNSSPEILAYHTGMKFFYNEGFGFSEHIFAKTGQRVGDVSSGGSVATSAFSLLYKMGIKTIILVGQDLAYTNNKSHADGTFQEIMPQENTSRFIMVEGNEGEKVPTRADFKLFLDWYNVYIEGCQKHQKDFRVINATEGGAKIQNTEIMTLREAVEQVCTREVDIQACLKKLHPMLKEEGRVWAVKYLHGLTKEFRQLKADAGKAKGLYQKLDDICNKDTIDEKKFREIYEKIKKLTRAIEMVTTYQLIAITMNRAQYILLSEQFVEEDSLQEEGKEIARKGILYMENVADMAELFQEYAEEVFGKEFMEQFGVAEEESEEGEASEEGKAKEG